MYRCRGVQGKQECVSQFQTISYKKYIFLVRPSARNSKVDEFLYFYIISWRKKHFVIFAKYQGNLIAIKRLVDKRCIVNLSAEIIGIKCNLQGDWKLVILCCF